MFPASPFNTFSYFLADVSRGQGSEAEGERLGSHPEDKSWERKFGSEQVPMVLHGDKESNQAMEDVSRSKQKLCDHAEPLRCRSVGCGTNAMQGKAQQHCKVGVMEGGCSSQGWRHNCASLQGPWAEQSIPGPSCWSRHRPAEVAPRVWGEL